MSSKHASSILDSVYRPEYITPECAAPVHVVHVEYVDRALIAEVLHPWIGVEWNPGYGST